MLVRSKQKLLLRGECEKGGNSALGEYRVLIYHSSLSCFTVSRHETFRHLIELPDRIHDARAPVSHLFPPSVFFLEQMLMLVSYIDARLSRSLSASKSSFGHVPAPRLPLLS